MPGASQDCRGAGPLARQAALLGAKAHQRALKDISVFIPVGFQRHGGNHVELVISFRRKAEGTLEVEFPAGRWCRRSRPVAR